MFTRTLVLFTQSQNIHALIKQSGIRNVLVFVPLVLHSMNYRFKFKIQLYTIIKLYYTVHIVSIIHTCGNSYITSIDMKCGKVANLYYAVFLSFHKLTFENKMFYLYLYSFGKLPLKPVRYTLATR